MKRGDKVALVACSNGIMPSQKEKIEYLKNTLMGIGQIPILSNCIYARNSVFSGTGRERADCLMGFFKDPEIKAIFDVSGGDLGNEVLPYLDYDVIKKSKATFWGYSDLTTIMNAIYTKTGKSSVLYQVCNLIGPYGEEQKRRWFSEDLYDFNYYFVQGNCMEGTVVGGNIRCLLKLAGTKYWPDMKGKILLLEAMGGLVPQMVTYLNQLKQMDVFEQVAGVILGTFTKMETEESNPTMIELVKQYVGKEIPIVKTNEIGHGTDSKAIVIGKNLILKGEER